MALAMMPLAAIRKVWALWPFSCLGTVLVITCIFAVLGVEGQQLASKQLEQPTLMNKNGFLVAIGQACFMFEGIGLVLPTYDASSDPDSFPRIYAGVQTCTLLLISAVGVSGYIAYGNHVQSLVLLNFPGGTVVYVLRLCFMVQVLCSFPLQLLPASRLVEDKFFEKVSNPSWLRKLAKTVFRAVLVAVLAGIAFCSADRLDNFVSLIGALCGVPLAFIFPAACHLHIVGRGKTLDVVMIGVGSVLTVVVTAVNVLAFIR